MFPNGFPWILFNYKINILIHCNFNSGFNHNNTINTEASHALQSTVLQYLWHGILIKNQGTEQFWRWNIQPDMRPELHSVTLPGMTKSYMKTKLNQRHRASEDKVWSLSISFPGKTKAKPNTGRMRIYSIDELCSR